jgi:hypothetical protein
MSERIMPEAIGANLGKILLIVVLAMGAVLYVLRPVPPPKGNPAVYERINAMTDCEALQREFEIADANHRRDLYDGKLDAAEVDTLFMRAANDRMEQQGCGSDTSGQATQPD